MRAIAALCHRPQAGRCSKHRRCDRKFASMTDPGFWTQAVARMPP
jgi:hypothetical protein